MTMPVNVELDSYRLIVTRRNTSEILVFSVQSESELPAVQILSNHRFADQLAEALRRQRQLSAYCLFTFDNQAIPQSKKMKYAVMECIHNNGTASTGTHWTSAETFCTGSDSEDSAIVRYALQEIKSYSSGMKTGPFGKPGWLKELFAWTLEQIDILGLRPTGSFTQSNASPTFSLIRLETTGPAVWFKATGKPNQHELPITIAIARMIPEYVPLILGVHPAWNGWLSGELPGKQLGEISEGSEWYRTAETLAQMQIDSAGGVSPLLEAGCKDLRLPNLIRQINPFLERMTHLMEIQEKRTPAPLDSDQIDLIRRRLNQACTQLHEVGLPDVLTHIDFNPGNILISPQRCAFLDWAEGSVANPLLTFEYLREHFNRRAIGNLQEMRNLEESYARPWRAFLPATAIRVARTCSPLVAAFAYAVQNGSWDTDTKDQTAQIAGYFRALTRRMHAEATRLTKAGVQCLG
jgi:hypothetical protein